ncbi:MAG TPA: hypothetical protein VI457_02120, partial [Methylococcaceae bacterium]|nr:hypothetical protein [Methylococcaceae bacterium]
MPITKSPLLRQWHILRLLPRYPRKLGIGALHERLSGEGFAVDVRTVQRDLVELSREFAIVSDEGRPAGWSWHRDAPQVNLPGLTATQALTFQLSERYLSAL